MVQLEGGVGDKDRKSLGLAYSIQITLPPGQNIDKTLHDIFRLASLQKSVPRILGFPGSLFRVLFSQNLCLFQQNTA